MAKAMVADIAHIGLSEELGQRVEAMIGTTIEISTARYDPMYQLGGAFYHPRGGGVAAEPTIIPSSRRFCGASSWKESDILLFPFRMGEKVIGHISVDDPADGRLPTQAILKTLEDMADVAAVALYEATSLQKLGKSHDLFRFLTEKGLTGMMVVEDEQVRYANESAATLLGYELSEFQRLSPWWSFIHPDDRPAVWGVQDSPHRMSDSIRAIRRDGRVIWLALSSQSMRRDGSLAAAIEFYDVTDHVARETELEAKAFRDPLTGLMNRAFFESAIQQEIERSKRYKRPITLLLGDLRRFKAINDALGHQEGDRVLAGVARSMQDVLRDSDWGIRYGGDEFLFVLPETGSGVDVVIARLQRAVEQWSVDNLPKPLSVGVDCGWASWSPDEPRPLQQIIAEADAVLYRSKRNAGVGSGELGAQV